MVRPPGGEPPDLSDYRDGNTGVAYVWRFDAIRPGPIVMINALTHGNEPCGAWALDQMLRHQLRPDRGSLILSFANVAAYRASDPMQPEFGRCIDEDLNRVWAPAILEGPRDSLELRRARLLRPILDQADILLDLHSMQDPAPPLLLCGQPAKNRNLARHLNFPGLIVADGGHAAGPRMLDYGGFGDPTDRRRALLVECGQHRADDSARVALATCLALLRHLGVVTDHAGAIGDLPTTAPSRPMAREIEVTQAITVVSDHFAFVRGFTGLEVIAKAGTVIGHDDDRPIRTPYDDCVLIMPARRLIRGQTAVRLGRFVA